MVVELKGATKVLEQLGRNARAVGDARGDSVGHGHCLMLAVVSDMEVSCRTLVKLVDPITQRATFKLATRPAIECLGQWRQSATKLFLVGLRRVLAETRRN